MRQLSLMPAIPIHRIRKHLVRGLQVAIAVFSLPAAQAIAAPIGSNAPYLYYIEGQELDPLQVMAATGIRQFTLAFVLSDGGCNPLWDGERQLRGAGEEKMISAIRAKGGDVVVSIGGSNGRKLALICSSSAALASAYRQVIDAYALRAIDIDLEGDELFDSSDVRQRIVDALTIIQTERPDLRIFITFGTLPTGPYEVQKDLMQRAAAAGLKPAAWTAMPFDFGTKGHTGSMAEASISSLNGVAAAVAAAYKYDLDTAFRHVGVSSMNGKTDQADETVSIDDFAAIAAFARDHQLARLTFWSVNRDQSCADKVTDQCSGITQDPYAFTKIVAGYGS